MFPLPIGGGRALRLAAFTRVLILRVRFQILAIRSKGNAGLLFVNVRGKLVLFIIINLDLFIGAGCRGPVEVDGVHEWWRTGWERRKKGGKGDS
jgi:hypothetical protein